MKKAIILYALFTSIFISAMGQNSIRLKIFSATDSSVLPGAIVKFIHTGKEALTNDLGEIPLSLSAGSHKIAVYHLGFKQTMVEFSLPGLKEISVFLKVDETQLKDVEINTGYIQAGQKSLTGSVYGVDNQLLNRSAGSNVLDRLKDIVPGLIFNRTGNATANPISIRGQSTLYANTQPLIILDNFPFTGEINSINPNDIESISILKDAAASAIWGARSGNGVIVITSKKGKMTAPRFSINANIEMGEKPDLFYRPRLGSADFIEVEKMLFARGFYTSMENSISKTALSPVVELLIQSRDGKINQQLAQAEIEAMKNFDIRREYSDLLSRGSVINRIAANLQGGNLLNQYYIGAGYDKSLLNDIGNQGKRYSFNFRQNISLLKGKLSAEILARYANTENVQSNQGYSNLGFITGTPIYPYARLRGDSGNSAIVNRDVRAAFKDSALGLLDWNYRPLDEIYNNDNRNTTANYSAQLNLKYTIINGLNFSLLYQYAAEDFRVRNLQGNDSYSVRHLINSFSKINADNSVTRPIPIGGILDYTNRNAISQNVRGQLTYERSFNNHKVGFFMGAELGDRSSISQASRLYGYDSEHAISVPVDYKSVFPLFYTPSSTNNLIPNNDNSSALIDRFISYYLNGNYSFENKYILSGSIRQDKSNIFGVNTNQKGVPLWSVGLSWNLSKENFYSSSNLPEIKARLSYGLNGNLDKSASAYTTASYSSSAPETNLPYAQIVNPPNPELRWERVATLNAGIDFSLKSQVFSGSVDFFTKKGTDIIGRTPYPPSSGVASFYGNIASTKSTGVEIVLNNMVNFGELNWRGTFLYSYSREIVTEYKLKASTSNYLTLQGTPLEGRPLYSIYNYEFAGLNPLTGDPLGYLNGEISKDYTKIIASYEPNSLLFSGSARPVHFGSFRNSFSYKNLSISANISYRAGYYFKRPVVLYNEILNARGGHLDYLKRWKVPGDELLTDIPSFTTVINTNRDNFYQYSSAAIQKGDHIRLQDLRLDYRFKDWSLLQSLNISDASIYIYGQNLGIIWRANKKSLDPDFVNSQPLKTVAFGLQLTL